MKKIISIITIAIVAAACNNAGNGNTTNSDTVNNEDKATKLYDSTNIPPKDSVGQYPNTK